MDQIKKLNLVQTGFSLVELLVAVAIIGILGSMAIVNFQKFVNKARQSEAKVNLAAIFAVEKGFQAETGFYSACLKQIGFEPEGTVVNPFSNFFNGYYTIGFNPIPATCGPTGAGSCLTTSWDSAGFPTSPCPVKDAVFFANHDENQGIFSVGDCTGLNCVGGAARSGEWGLYRWSGLQREHGAPFYEKRCLAN